MNNEHEQWLLDVANKLPTYEEIKGHLNPALKSRTLELAKEWAVRIEDDLLNQDKDKKLANWFTSKVDAKEAFRRVLRGEKK